MWEGVGGNSARSREPGEPACHDTDANATSDPTVKDDTNSATAEITMYSKLVHEIDTETTIYIPITFLTFFQWHNLESYGRFEPRC